MEKEKKAGSSSIKGGTVKHGVKVTQTKVHTGPSSQSVTGKASKGGGAPKTSNEKVQVAFSARKFSKGGVGDTMNACGTILTKLMKTKIARFFISPVDPVAYNLQDYFDIIKHPMDLGTVKSKLAKNHYAAPSDFAYDVRLTFNNALTYNPSGHEVNTAAMQLLKKFEELYRPIHEKFEDELQTHVELERERDKGKKKHNPIPIPPQVVRRQEPLPASTSNQPSTSIPPLAQSPERTPSPMRALAVKPLKQPKPKFAKGGVVDTMKACGTILTKLLKTKIARFFISPVDTVAYNLHDYFDIIKHPMDLGTVKSKLAMNHYAAPSDFAYDVRLTFNNALTYNPSGHEVNTAAMQLLTKFEELYAGSSEEVVSEQDATPAKKRGCRAGMPWDPDEIAAVDSFVDRNKKKSWDEVCLKLDELYDDERLIGREFVYIRIRAHKVYTATKDDMKRVKGKAHSANVLIDSRKDADLLSDVVRAASKAGTMDAIYSDAFKERVKECISESSFDSMPVSLNNVLTKIVVDAVGNARHGRFSRRIEEEKDQDAGPSTEKH